jgi:thymidylate kinase
MKKGKVIVIEGVDGAGKTTQIDFLKDFLARPESEEKYGKTIFLKEPGTTEAG